VNSYELIASAIPSCCCRLRVLLVLVDDPDNVQQLLELNRLAVLSGCTLILAWTYKEAARYLETYKAYENKPATSIQEKVRSSLWLAIVVAYLL